MVDLPRGGGIPGLSPSAESYCLTWAMCFRFGAGSYYCA